MNNIILLFGGDSCERDISIITAIQVYENIDKSKYNVYPIFMYEGHFYYIHNMMIDNFINYKVKKSDLITFDKSRIIFKNKLIRRHIKVTNAILANHGGSGENGALQGLLDIYGIPYTSPSSLASSVLMDKVVTKYILAGLNIPYVDYVVSYKDTYTNYVNIVKKLGYPVIVKPATLGSSIGISKVNEEGDLKDALELAFYYDDKVIIEKALEDFVEYNIALMRCDGKIILSDIESPKTKCTILGFSQKYLTNGKINGGYREFPAKITKNLKEEIESYAKIIYEALDMKGVVRIDYLFKDGILYLNEVNTIPGSLAYYLFERKKLTFTDLIDKMIEESTITNQKSGNLIKYYKSSVLNSAKCSNNKLRK